MAQNVNPFARKSAPVPQPVDPGQQAALKARAQGRPQFATPPPAKPIPGVTGNPPLPAGRPVGHVAPSSLTELEREALAGVGYDPNIGLPQTHEGAKALQQAVAAQMSVEVPLPVAPNTPPLKVNTIPISQLPPDRQKAFTGAINATIEGITAQEKQAADARRRQSTMMTREAAAPGVGAAVGAADRAVDEYRRKAAELANVPLDEIPDVVPSNPAAVEAIRLQNHFDQTAAAQKTAPAVGPPAQQAPPRPAPASETGADAGLTHCPHCQWELVQPDIPEPPYQDKIAFIHSMLGDKPFAKVYPLFNGQAGVTFRTLTTREIDLVYLQVQNDRLEGRVTNEMDYLERINRYRLMLQLQKFESYGPAGFIRDLPDAYSARTNPNGTGFWATAEQESELGPNQTGLPSVEEWVLDNVLKTEATFRVVSAACSRFNRLAAKMEAMADHSDFWNPTGEPS